MVWNTDTMTNDAAPTVNDVKLNALNAEQASLVTTTGQTPNQTINDQMGKGAAILASGSVDQYTISGGPVAYLATPIAPVTPISPTGLFTGLRVRGVFNVTNTGGAMTINPNGIGATPVKLVDGTDPVAGDLLIGQQIDMFHDGVNFVVTTAVPSIIGASVPVASQAEMEAATIDTSFATPGNTIFHSGVGKAWAYFDAQSNIIPAPFSSFNISSIVRVGANGTGTYDITFTNAFLSITDYGGGGSTGGIPPGGTFFDRMISIVQQSATVARVFLVDAATSTAIDADRCFVEFSGDLA